MLLKKLEMYGFKSFADRIEIQFDQGITAIVGPNGSGKSNVADAVRWVLGEQSAKSLRGSKMEDIIFSGTQIRKPLGFAEVSLTLDNTDHALPVDFSEVTITRRVFRSGESEYYINRSSCRLRDIIELFMDTGVGKEGYSIIGQGRIDEILSTQPENRRMIFEEAAGIVKYKSRKQESQRKLERTQENIVRVEDILNEITHQLRPLEEQSKTAREYLNLRDNLKSYDLNKFIFEYDGYKKKIEDIKQNKSLIDGDIINHRQSIHEEEIKENKLNEESVNLDKRIQSIRDNRFTILNEAEKLRGKIEVIQERIAQLDREKIRLEQEIQWGKQTIEEKQIEKTNSSEELKIGKQTLSTIVQKSELLTRRLEFIKNQLSSSHIEAQAKKDRIMQIWNSLSKTKNTITKYQTLEENLLSQRKQSNDHLKELGRSWETLTSKHRNIEQNIENLNKKLLRRRNENDILEEKAQFLEKKIEEWDNKLQLQKQQLEGEKSRLNLLIDMSNSYDGFQKSVKGILRACQSNASIKDRVCGVIAELVRVPKEYETAIETALGFSLQHIVTHSEEDAKYIIEFLRNRRLGRATFLPISSIKGRNLYNREKTVLSMEGCLGRGVDLIEFDSQYKEIFTNLLGRVIITENLEQAINIAKNFSYSFRVVTLEGDVMNSGGSMTGGSMNKRTTGIIGRGREIDDLKDKTAKLVKDMESGIVKRKVCLEEYTELRGNLKDILPQIHQLEIQIATGREHLDGTSLEIERADREIQSLRQKDVKLAQEIVTMKESIDKQDKLSAELEKQSKDIQAVADNTDSSIESINKEKDQIEEESTRIKIEEARLDHEIHSLEEKLILINRDIENYTISINKKSHELDENLKTAEKFEQEIIHQNEHIEALDIKAKDNEETLDLKQLNKENLLKEINGIEARKKELGKVIEEIRERKHSMEVQLSRAEIELENSQNRVWEEYELSYAHALDYKDDTLNITGIRREIQNIRKKIDGLGNINVNAVEEYKRIKERYDFLTLQKDDLTTAKDNLQGIIEDITATMEEKFVEEFAIINRHFNKVFSQLFGGGKAELVLEDLNDVLTSGIEIVAQPPGKKLQSISLLSGGEKALTAISILFAILETKPTPFCVLDEIEAALDESNVRSFGQFIRKFSENTQFVLITHRKGTMENSDVLYGVAMEEKGVSRMISVRLEDQAS